jgi:hypothetical protein
MFILVNGLMLSESLLCVDTDTSTGTCRRLPKIRLSTTSKRLYERYDDDEDDDEEVDDDTTFEAAGSLLLLLLFKVDKKAFRAARSEVCFLRSDKQDEDAVDEEEETEEVTETETEESMDNDKL